VFCSSLLLGFFIYIHLCFCLFTSSVLTCFFLQCLLVICSSAAFKHFSSWNLIIIITFTLWIIILRPTVGRPVGHGIKHPSGVYDQVFITVRQLRVLLMRGALSDERTGLLFTIAAGPRQRSNTRVLLPWDSRPYFTLSDYKLPFSSLPTTRRSTVEVSDTASTGITIYSTSL
jgi:hypothetical protein